MIFILLWVSESHEVLHRMQILGSGGNMQFLIKRLRCGGPDAGGLSAHTQSTATEYAKESQQAGEEITQIHGRKNTKMILSLSKNLTSEEYLGLCAKSTYYRYLFK